MKNFIRLLPVLVLLLIGSIGTQAIVTPSPQQQRCSVGFIVTAYGFASTEMGAWDAACTNAAYDCFGSGGAPGPCEIVESIYLANGAWRAKAKRCCAV